MSRRDPHADDVHETPDDLQDRYGDDADDADSTFPYPTVPFGWPANVFGTGPDDDYDRDYDDTSYEQETPDRHATGEDDSWLDEGLIGLVLVAGLVLFLIPEPGTSAVGILLLVGGAAAWIADALT